ncbi:MAG: nucleotide exchange factor GrpE [Bacteroidetes bacterium]|nr:nucleotide exchange factor GrpE [Bacteroidota bacterium]
MKTDNIDKLRLKVTHNLTEILDMRGALKQKDLEYHDMMKKFFLSIIDVLDSFERKEENLKEKYLDKIEGVEKIIKSYSSIQKKLVNILASHAITKLDFPENKLIVGFSRVVETAPDSKLPADTIISIVRNGYVRGSEVIREAELIIVKN